VAFTVTLILEVQAGAVSTPELEMVPAEVDQVTAVFVVPLTLAVNCWVPPAETVALGGEIETDTVPGGFTVTVADAELAVLAWLVALTVTEVVEVTEGAVRSPEVEMDPAEVDQVAAVFDDPLTVAVNCWVPPEETVALAGEIATDTVAGGLTVTVAAAELELLAWLVALTVTEVVEVTLGAVSSPEVEMDPAEVDQVTAVFDVPLTVEVNCWVPPEETVALAGDIETDP